MKLQFRQIEPFVKNPPPEAMAILIYGPDEGLVRERMTIMTKNIVADPNDPFNVTEFTGPALEDNPARLIDEAQSISMLGGRRVIRLRDASDKNAATIKDVLKQLKKGDNLILVEAGELNPRSTLRLLFEQADNAAALPCYVEDERDIGRILQDGLKAQGYSISSEALVHMAANVVGDRAVARSEIEKIITYMGPQKSIDIDDAIACVGNSASLSMDLLCKAVASGNFTNGERVLKNVLSEGTPAVSVLRALQNYFGRIYITKLRVQKGDNLEIAMKKLRPEVFWKNKDAFMTQVNNWTQAQIEQAQAALMTAEARTKQTGSDPELIVSRAILSLSQMEKTASTRRRA
jgi:DNA polymerase-3 subunit delta